MEYKLLIRLDEKLFLDWAKDFIKQYPGENGWLKCSDRFYWLYNRALKDGYKISYDNAEFDFMDIVFKELKSNK